MDFMKNETYINLLYVLENALTNTESYAKLYKTTISQAEVAINIFSEMKDRASLGDISARNSLIDHFVKVMESDVYAQQLGDIEGLLDYKNIVNNEPEIIFDLLMENRSLAGLIEKYDIKISWSEKQLIDIALEEMVQEDYTKKYRSRREKLRFIALFAYSKTYGQDCIESLQYQDINEIGVLNKNYIYIVYKGMKIRLKFLKFDNVDTIINIQKKTTQNSSLNFDRQNPIIVASKINSSRISAAGYDVTPSGQDAYYNERIFNLKVVSLEDLLEKYSSLNYCIYELLMINQEGKGSFIVSGSDMGVGKSTLMLSMIEKYNEGWGIGVLDPQNELQIGVKYPDKNVITLVENSRKSMSQCFAYLLKTSRDVMVVSEITMPEEVSELINSALRLNAGVCATMHSLSPEEIIPNLRNLMLKTDMYKDRITAEDDLAVCLDLLIHLRRLQSGRIIVDSIHEVCIYRDKKEIQELNPLMEKQSKKDQLLNLGVMALRDAVIQKRYFLNSLVKYVDEESCWRITGVPSEAYINKMRRYVPHHVMERFIKDWNIEARKDKSHKIEV